MIRQIVKRLNSTLTTKVKEAACAESSVPLVAGSSTIDGAAQKATLKEFLELIIFAKSQKKGS